MLKNEAERPADSLDTFIDLGNEYVRAANDLISEYSWQFPMYIRLNIGSIGLGTVLQTTAGKKWVALSKDLIVVRESVCRAVVDRRGDLGPVLRFLNAVDDAAHVETIRNNDPPMRYIETATNTWPKARQEVQRVYFSGNPQATSDGVQLTATKADAGGGAAELGAAPASVDSGAQSTTGKKRGRKSLSEEEQRLGQLFCEARKHGTPFLEIAREYRGSLESDMRRRWNRGPAHQFDDNELKREVKRLHDSARKKSNK